MNPSAIIAALVWSIALGAASFMFGCHTQANADQAAQLEAADNAAETQRIKNRAALGAGLRAEKAQDKTDAIFQKIRNDYETEERKAPGIGCVLDPVSLRLWNEANTQSDGAAASELADGVPAAADPSAGRERGE